MDARGNIFIAPTDEATSDERARLDGYLRGRAEEGSIRILNEAKRLVARAAEHALVDATTATLSVSDWDAILAVLGPRT